MGCYARPPLCSATTRRTSRGAREGGELFITEINSGERARDAALRVGALNAVRRRRRRLFLSTVLAREELHIG